MHDVFQGAGGLGHGLQVCGFQYEVEFSGRDGQGFGAGSAFFLVGNEVDFHGQVVGYACYSADQCGDLSFGIYGSASDPFVVLALCRAG